MFGSSEVIRLQRCQEVRDEVKDEEDGHGFNKETNPRPHLHVGHGIQC